MQQIDPSFPAILSLRRQVRDYTFDYWIHHDLWSFNWWLLLAIALLPWVLWAKVSKIKQQPEILVYGLFVAIVSLCLDVIGSDLVLWGYYNSIIPTTTPLLPLDISGIPVSYMFLYEYFKTWRTFCIAQFFWAAGSAFLIEPFFIYIKVYEMYQWRHLYSFTAYFLLGIGLRALVKHLVKSPAYQKQFPSTP